MSHGRKIWVEWHNGHWRGFYVDGTKRRRYLEYDFTKNMERIKAFARLHGYQIQLGGEVAKHGRQKQRA